MVELVLVHAFPLDARMWSPQGSAFDAVARLHTPDLPGFGASPAPPLRTLDGLAQALDEAVTALGLDRFVLGGLSMGGYVALAWLRRFGTARLAGLVLADTRAAPDSEDGKAARNKAISLVRAEGVAAFAALQLPKMFAGGVDSAPAREAGAIMRDQRPETVIAALEALRDRPDARPVLAAVDVPTLVLCGAADEVTPPAEARLMAASIAGARYVELPAAGHLSNLEAPAPFADALRGFVRGL